jgi:hypothetical protein
MASEPLPSLQIEPHQTLGLNLVGTVALPGPYPAEGRIYVVRHPAPKGAKGADAKPSYHLKIVQKFSDSHSVTRVISLDHVRLIRYNQSHEPPPAGSGTSAKATAPPSQLSHDELQKEVAAIPWEKSVKDERGCYEAELFTDQPGVVYVPEPAPVLLRYEATVPAATSLDSLVYAGGLCPPTGTRLACPHR